MRWINSVLMPFVLMTTLAHAAMAMGPPPSKNVDPKRIALLIGNTDYAATVGPLTNPGNDVDLIASALEKIGFARRNIHTVINADRVATLKAIDEYANKVAAAGPNAVAFFYYSGHGAASQRDRRNYIIPTGVKALDRSVWYQAVALDDVVSQLANLAPNAAHFVIFDACRNLLKMPTKGRKGFVPMSEKSGMLIAFSTDPGETASDEGAGAGPYASALAAELVKPGQDHLDLFQNVKERVHRTTSGQRPWERNGLLKRVYLNGSSNAAGRGAAEAWQAVKNSNDLELLQSFASRFAGTFFAELATQRVKKLSGNSSRTTTPRSDFRLTAPKWQRVKGFQRISRSETEQLLRGNTAVAHSGQKWRRFFAVNGSYTDRSGSGVISSGSWKVGQTGIIHAKPKKIANSASTKDCAAVISYNPTTRGFRWDWQKPCTEAPAISVKRGNQINP